MTELSKTTFGKKISEFEKKMLGMEKDAESHKELSEMVINNMDEKITSLCDKLDEYTTETKTMLVKHEHILMGDEVKEGLISMVKSNKRYVDQKKDSLNSIINVIYKIIVVAGVGVILAKIGL